MNDTPINDMQLSQITDLPFHEKVKMYMEQYGIMKKWLADKVLRSPGWMTQFLDGDIEIDQEMKKRIEAALEIPSFKTKS